MDICFFPYILAFVNDTAMSVIISETLLSIPLCIYSEIGLLGCIVIPYFAFLGKHNTMFSRAAPPFYIATNRAHGFQHAHIFINWLFSSSHNTAT